MKVGDRVKVIWPHTYRYGRTGTIKRTNYTNSGKLIANILFDNGGAGSLFTYKLEVIKKKKLFISYWK